MFLNKNTLIALVLGVLVMVGLVSHAIYYLYKPLQANSRSVDLLIIPGSSFGRIVADLKQKDVVQKPFYLKVYARLSGKAGQIKAGEYQLDTGLSPVELLDKLVLGDVKQYSLTIVEGWSFRQLRLALSSVGPQLVLTTEEMDDQQVMAAIGYPEIHPEGQFMADTYAFTRGTKDIDVLQRAYQATQVYLQEVWPQRKQGLPISTPYEALILASIVEKETAKAEERPLIATVFMSRLRKNMRLQTDPTIIYGMGNTFNGNIRRRHLTQDTPYNTYTRHGLTPTPIAMPGRAAIDAVLHPEETDALYFVARGDGSHQFSRTLEQHERAVDQYQRKRRTKSSP